MIRVRVKCQSKFKAHCTDENSHFFKSFCNQQFRHITNRFILFTDRKNDALPIGSA